MIIQRDHKYFVHDQITWGKAILLQANIEGDKNARYGLAIVLLCESNDKRRSEASCRERVLMPV